MSRRVIQQRHILLCLSILGGACLVSACEKGPSAPAAVEQPYDIKTLMQIVVQPQADVYWKSTGSISDANGTRDLTPTTDAGWLNTRSSAATLAVMGALLKNPVYAEGKGEDWNEYADALTALSLKAEQAAIARDPEAVMEVGNSVYNVCAACHQAYQPPVQPEKIPGSSDF